MMALDCGGRRLDLSRAAIMGILNITPDSFSDGGVFLDPQKAVDHAVAMVEQGADLIDIGGESTRPGAQAVSAQAELDRVMPVLEALVPAINIPISVDTSKPEVMQAASAAGAGMINDVCALSVDGAIAAATDSGLPVCLMHMQGEPRSMQEHPEYKDIVKDIIEFFEAQIAICESAGLKRSRLIIDPGFGFGKTLDHNLELLRRLSEFKVFDLPIMVGLSRKSMIGMALDLPVDQRVNASLALALAALRQGANIIRVHDVRATVEAVRMHEEVYKTTD